MSLFRKEAVVHQGERLMGVISLAQPLSIKLTVLILVLIAATIVIKQNNHQGIELSSQLIAQLQQQNSLNLKANNIILLILFALTPYKTVIKN